MAKSSVKRKRSAMPAKSRKRAKRSPIVMNSMNAIVKYKKYAYYENNWTTGNAMGFANAFTVQQLDSMSRDDFTSRFRAYRIDSIELRFKMWTNPNAQGDLNDFNQEIHQSVAGFPHYYQQDFNTYPKLWIATDLTNAQTPTTLQDIKEYAGVKCFILKPDTFVSYKMRPKPQMEVYQSAVSTGYGPSPGSVWIDMANLTVPHYGVKYHLDCGAEGLKTNLSIGVDVIYNMSFKNAI